MCNLYQNTKGILHRNTKKNSQIHVEPEKINSLRKSEKKRQNWRPPYYLTSKYTIERE
jgi:hypothetical protein